MLSLRAGGNRGGRKTFSPNITFLEVITECACFIVGVDSVETIVFLYPLQVNDECALSQSVKEEMYKCYPEARRAHMKDGGNFPYLSRSDEVNLYIQVYWIIFSSLATM